MTDPHDFSDVSFEQLAKAFVYPPRIIPLGLRHVGSDGQIVVVSHVEIWPWRVVVQGARTRSQAEIDALRPRFHQPSMPDTDLLRDMPVDQPTITVVTGEVDPTSRNVWRKNIDANERWYSAWDITDDVGTEYWFVGHPRRQNERIEDFAIERHPQPPTTATELRLATPLGPVIRIPLTSREN